MVIRGRLTLWSLATLALFALLSAPHEALSQEAAAERPYLGIQVEPVDESGAGVFVAGVDKEGPAGKAGLKVNDVIESINGTAIGKTADMSAAMKNQGVGAKLTFVVNRSGTSVTANVTLVAAPEGAAAGGVPVDRMERPSGEVPPPELPDPDSTSPSTDESEVPRPYLGLTVVSHARGGAAISSIRKDSPAARVGFPLGAVIVRANDTPIDSSDDLINFIAAMDPGKTIELSYMHNNRLFRKSVKLSSLGGAPEAVERIDLEPVSPPPAPMPRDDRPLLNGIGRVLGGGPLAPAGDGGMQKQIDELRALTDNLLERIKLLEDELAAMKAAPPAEATGELNPPAAPTP